MSGPADTAAGAESDADPATLLHACAGKPRIYTDREVDFLRSVRAALDNGRSLTAAQIEWLAALAAREEVDFAAVASGARSMLPALCKRWLPDGALYGKEYVARNPTRHDANPGSFRINVQTGKWADFATKDSGGDAISLAAYLFHNGDQVAAALDVKRMLSL